MTKAPVIKQICFTMVTLLALLACITVVAQSMGCTPAREKSYGGIGSNVPSVQMTADGGYIAAGTASTTDNGSQAYMFKTGADGAHRWHRYYGAYGSMGNSVQQTGDAIGYSPYVIDPKNIDHYPMLQDNPLVATGLVWNTRSGTTYETIQAAIEDINTVSGDTILVGSGTYRENVAVSKAVNLMGSGSPVVDGSGGNYSIWIEADGVTLQGFNVTNASSTVVVTSSHDRLTGNNVYNNVVDQGNGINVTGSYNELTNNSAWDNSNDGINVLGSFNNVSDNQAYDNGGGGIGVNGSDNVVSGNIAYLNAIDIWLSGLQNSVTGNTATDGYYGIELYGSTNNSVTNNTIRDNNLGLQLFNSTGTTAWLNRFDNNQISVRMYGSPDNHWNSPMPLQYTYSGHVATSNIGNYWSDYQGQDANSDGIGDAPYEIDLYNQDRYPMLHGTVVTVSDLEQDMAPYTTFVGTRGEVVN